MASGSELTPGVLGWGLDEANIKARIFAQAASTAFGSRISIVSSTTSGSTIEPLCCRELGIDLAPLREACASYKNR